MFELKVINRPTNFFRFATLLFLFLSIGFVFAIQLPNSVKGKSEDINKTKTREADVGKRESNNFLKTLLPNPSLTPEIPHTLVGSYYLVDEDLDAKLLLNNKGNAPLEVSPTLYNEQGQELQLPSVTVEPQSFRFINLQDWAAIGGESFKSGNIKLFHYGKDLVLGAQIYLTDETRSLSYEEKLAEKGKFDSRRQEAVWWMPSNSAKVGIVLTNTTDAPLSVTGRLAKKSNTIGNPHTIQLAAHQTRLFDLRNDFPEGNQIGNSDIAALSLEHNSAKDALLARMIIAEPQRGYSNVVQFSNPNGGASREYQGVGFQIEDVGNERLTPVIVARNVGNVRATVNARVPYTRADGTRGTINLPQEQLNSGEMRLLKVQKILQRVQQEQIAVASLEVEYDTAPGSVIVAAHTVSDDHNQVFRVPMWDPLGQRSPTGGYPWRIEGTSVTETYIKNIADYEEDYVAFLLWENGGIYMIGLKPIAAHETVHIDIKKLRDEQIPDERGRTIPLHIQSGQLQWTLRRKDNLSEDNARANLSLIGRSEQVDLTKKIANNYSCQNCCSGDFVRGYLEAANPNQTYLDLEVQSSRFYFAVEEEQTCYGYQYGVIVAHSVYNATWNTSDSNVATVSSNSTGGTVTGVNAGNVQISAKWRRQNSIVYPCSPGGGFSLVQEIGEDRCATEENSIEPKSFGEVYNSPNEQKTDGPIYTPNIAACGTCSSRFSDFTARLNLYIKPKIKILRDLQDITNTPQTVIVGQRINLSAQIIGGGSASSQQWTLPATVVKDFAVSADNAQGSATAVDGLDTPNVNFVWVDGDINGNTIKRVTYNAIVAGQSIQGEASFKVYRPTSSATTQTNSTTTIDNVTGNLELHLGDPNSTAGIRFLRGLVSVPQPFLGQTQWVQLYDSKIVNATLVNGQTDSVNTNGLDGCYPYTTVDAPTASDSPGFILSSPSLPSPIQSISTNNTWTMWLMFKPSDIGSSWVPLRKVTWSWSASASRQPDGTYILNSSSNPNVPAFVDTNQYPQWSSIVQTIQSNCTP